MITLFTRPGFAHNSSSNHGIMFKKDVLNINNFKFEKAIDYDYGWENFLLSNREDKLKYILTQLVCFINEKYVNRFSAFCLENQDVNKKIKEMIENSKLNEFLNFPSISTNFRIDHQSTWNFPISFNTDNNFCNDKLNNFISVDFAYDFIKYLLQDKINIVGGNDNDPLDFEDTSIVYLGNYLRQNGCIMANKDATGNWILSNNDFGDMTIVNFEDNNIEKLNVPYLIDINITDKCNNNCSFCYRSCNNNGNHASYKDISNALELLHFCGVMEFVIGGGDITEHNDINHLFCIFKRYKTSCTLHYKSFIKIVENGSIVQYLKSFKSIAISLTDADDCAIKRINEIINNLDCRENQFNYQFIAELTPISRLKSIYHELSSGISFNILGYKETGRGSIYSECNNLINIDQEYIKGLMKFRSVSCDATFAKKYREILIKNGASDLHLAKQDGLCTCFYDLVGKYIQQSSYSNEIYELNIKDFVDGYGWLNYDGKNNFKNKFIEIFSKF